VLFREAPLLPLCTLADVCGGLREFFEASGVVNASMSSYGSGHLAGCLFPHCSDGNNFLSFLFFLHVASVECFVMVNV